MNYTYALLDLASLVLFFILHIGVFSNIWKELEKSRFKNKLDLITNFIGIFLITAFSIFPILHSGTYTFVEISMSIVTMIAMIILCAIYGEEDESWIITFCYSLAWTLILVVAMLMTIPDKPKIHIQDKEVSIIPTHSYRITTPDGYKKYEKPKELSFEYKGECDDTYKSGFYLIDTSLKNSLLTISESTTFIWKVENKIDDVYNGTALFETSDGTNHSKKCKVSVSLTQSELNELYVGGTRIDNIGN